MVRHQRAVLAQARRTSDKVEAWILGSSVASLASAIYLISDANVPASQIHILESDSTPGDGITSNGDPLSGYDHRPGCLPSFNDVCMRKLLAMVPSASGPGRTVLDDIENFYYDQVCQDIPVTHVLIQGDHGPKRSETREIDLALQDRMRLTMLMLRSEKRLARKRIDQLFNKPFFDSRFWIIFSTLFSFQPWHSAAEFRRCLRRYLREFPKLNTKKPLDCTQFNQFESVIMPIIQFLQNQGVDFRVRIKVTDILSHSDGIAETVSAIYTVRDSSQETITIHPDNIVIISLRSVTSGTTSGTNESPPLLETMFAENEFDENWSLWLDLGTKDPKFGNPYNFCTRIEDSRLGSFTVTLKDTEFFERFTKLTYDKPGIGNFMSFKDSNWMISVCIPRQPFFLRQPKNMQAFWGYYLFPEREASRLSLRTNPKKLYYDSVRVATEDSFVIDSDLWGSSRGDTRKDE